MGLTTFLAIATARSVQGNIFNIPIEEPVLGFQREIAIGPLPHPMESIGLYHTRTSGMHSTSDGFVSFAGDAGSETRMIGGAPVSEENRIGQSTWSVKPGVIGDKLCYVIEVDANRLQLATIKVHTRRNLEQKARNVQKRTYYVSEDGKLLYEQAECSNLNGTFTLEAKYGADDYEVTTTGPKRRQTRTITPGFGMELFHNAFKPMLKGQDVLLPEKEFALLDPYTGAPVKYKAKVIGRFDGKFFSMQFQGRYIEITGEQGLHQQALVSYEGKLMRVNMPKSFYLHIEEKPSKPTLRHKPGG